MRKPLTQKIEIPEGVEVNVDGALVSVKGSEGEIKRKFLLGKLNLDKKDNEIVIEYEKSTKNEKKNMNTIASHINNMIKGVKEKFEYKLKVCSSHFPMSVDVKDSEAVVKNFLGEKIPRKVKLLEGVDVSIDGQIITIISHNKELAGQTAANFEKATRITGRDRRVFQDGIFITSKCGREI
ncbi:MAG: 50S ribosomal protein L6 [archaeon]